MRIGIDMLAVQSPGSRLRGVGRYGQNLVTAMLQQGCDHDFVLYTHEGMPTDLIPISPNAKLTTLAVDTSRGETMLRDAMNRLARTNPDHVDILLMLSPFELCPGYDPPAKPIGGPKMGVVVHDLIPFLDPEKYLDDPGNAAWFYRRLRSIQGYDFLLTNSEATRDDCLAMLKLPPNRVVSVSGAGNGAFFVPDPTLPVPFSVRSALARLGIHRPYVFCVAGADDRKNVWGLLDAFRRLPIGLRTTHHVVVTCHLKTEDERKIREFASERGLSDSLVLTGEVSDPILRTLYQHCSAFAFPSLYEGLGLPLLEAMHCGAAVIAGKNSSQIEVVGDAGLLVNARDTTEIASGLKFLLENPSDAARLGKLAIARASEFTWERSADRALAVISNLTRRTPNLKPRHDRPRVAIVSPFAPKKSGISTYAARLARELARRYHVDLYHDEGYVPDLGLDANGFSSFDHRLFSRFSAIRNYRSVLYQMGNSPYHGFLYEMLAKHPGIVTLHDFSLSGFQYLHAHRNGDPTENFRRVIEHAEPHRAPEILLNLQGWSRERGGIQEAFTRRGIHLNREIFDASRQVVVHSPWCLDQATAMNVGYAEKTRVIPLGANPVVVDPERRRQIRLRFGLDEDRLIFASFGILSHGKMNVEAIRAFSTIAAEFPRSQFLLVGQDWEQGEARKEVESLHLEQRVRFLGHQSDDDFDDLIAIADIGISLRRPPTYGETSAALLDLLRHGTPSIVTDVATFADYPDEVVAKVRWDRDGMDMLTSTMRELAASPARRSELGEAAFRYVAEHHSWNLAATMYSDLIDETVIGTHEIFQPHRRVKRREEVRG